MESHTPHERLYLAITRCVDNMTAILKVINMVTINEETIEAISRAIQELKQMADIMEKRILEERYQEFIEWAEPPQDSIHLPHKED